MNNYIERLREIEKEYEEMYGEEEEKFFYENGNFDEEEQLFENGLFGIFRL